MRGWQGRKMVNTNTGEKIKPNIRSLGCCGLQFFGAENGLLAIALQNSSTIFRHAVRAIQGA
jgi:hypothetical protein